MERLTAVVCACRWLCGSVELHVPWGQCPVSGTVVCARRNCVFAVLLHRATHMARWRFLVGKGSCCRRWHVGSTFGIAVCGSMGFAKLFDVHGATFCLINVSIRATDCRLRESKISDCQTSVRESAFQTPDYWYAELDGGWAPLWLQAWSAFGYMPAIPCFNLGIVFLHSRCNKCSSYRSRSTRVGSSVSATSLNQASRLDSSDKAHLAEGVASLNYLASTKPSRMLYLVLFTEGAAVQAAKSPVTC